MKLFYASVLILCVVGCATVEPVEPTEREAIQAQAHTTIDAVLDDIPGAQAVGAASTLIVMIWGAIWGKKKVAKKMKQMKDSEKGEFFSKK